MVNACNKTFKREKKHVIPGDNKIFPTTYITLRLVIANFKLLLAIINSKILLGPADPTVCRTTENYDLAFVKTI